VLPVDVPFIRPAQLHELAVQCIDAAVPQTGPLPGAYRKSALHALERRLAANELTLHQTLAELDVRVVELDPATLVNINEPADLERVQCRIVPYEERHRDGFRTLVSDTLREFGFEPDPELDPDLLDPAGAYTSLWIAVSDGRVVGSVALGAQGSGTLVLKRMYLRPEQRGRGLGRRLLETALAEARASGAKRVKLDTTERMEAARALYERYGFKQVRGDDPRQGQRRLLYELDL
jgi:putative acetyltransferase